jgi:biotin transport system substrate-specific component
MQRGSSSTGRPARRLDAADLARVAVGAGLIAVLGLPGLVSVPGTSVPITLQTMGIMLVGSLLGARRGALAVVVFLVLVAVGLPLLAGGRGGLGVFAGPSGGFLLAWPLGAWVVGRLVEPVLPRYRVSRGIVAHLVGGMLVVYALGVPWLAWRTDLDLGAAAAVSLAYVPGDILKAVVAALVARGVHRALPVEATRPSHDGQPATRST